MHNCACPNCMTKIQNKYKYCYEHRNTVHVDVCKRHGKTMFRGNQCLLCEKDKRPIYRIEDGLDMSGESICEAINILYPYRKRLQNLSRSYQRTYITYITSSPGIYGIFVRHGKHLGTCLYVGQSVNIKNRVQQHRKCIITAQRHLNRLHAQHKRKISHYKVEYKYYQIAKQYKLSDIKFVTLWKLQTTDQQILTYCEQAMIDAYKPKLNTLAARPTKE